MDSTQIIFIAISFILGAIISWLFAKQKLYKDSISKSDYDSLQEKLTELSGRQQASLIQQENLLNDLKEAKSTIEAKEQEIRKLSSDIASLNTKLISAKANEDQTKEQLSKSNDLVESLKGEKLDLTSNNKALVAEKTALDNNIEKLNKDIESISEKLELKTNEFNEANKKLATQIANNKALEENYNKQKEEIEKLGKKFNQEFENIANKILEEKTNKFTNVNKENLATLLNPLGENIKNFKKQVEESYINESRERKSLEDQVRQMAELNRVISEEAKNLTNALKGEAKTQGNWGEMILESILEKSGLRKDEEYFMEHQLLDDEGRPLKSDSENKKMRPDAVVKYPDNRNVIIDSKVSLTAFTRYLKADTKEDQDKELEQHLISVKNHINELSKKGYDDYNKALDFVMMFIPSEPAYIAAMQADSNIWNYAYEKRILLMNPTNLITSLKLIVDLWKREYQNKHAIEIADRGAKLYDKFVGFVKNLEELGKSLDRANEKYTDAYKQLSTGNDNLVLQTSKLKNLGIKAKKALPENMVNEAELSSNYKIEESN